MKFILCHWKVGTIFILLYITSYNLDNDSE